MHTNMLASAGRMVEMTQLSVSLPHVPAGQPAFVFMMVTEIQGKKQKCASACVKFAAIPSAKANYIAKLGVSAEGCYQGTGVQEDLKNWGQ